MQYKETTMPWGKTKQGSAEKHAKYFIVLFLFTLKLNGNVVNLVGPSPSERGKEGYMVAWKKYRPLFSLSPSQQS